MTDVCFAHAGADLYALDTGTGSPIILLHGGLADHRAALRIGAPLADRYRTITPDLRAAGRSHFAGPLSWELLAGDIAALIRHLGLGRAVVAGTSFGAGVALRVALDHPDVVAKLALLHPAYAGPACGLTEAQTTAMAAMNAAGARCVADGMSALDPLVATLPPDWHVPVRAMFAGFDPASVAATTAFMATHAQPFEHPEQLARITCPTLVVPGIDPQHPAEHADYLAGHILGSQLVSTTDLTAALATFVS